MDISVIVPIYGVEKYIEKSLRSLFSQTKIEGVEFILVNDQTKDRSIEIAREVIADFPALDIKIVEHEVNRGLAASRQTGMNMASGDYVIHIDSDDWCEPEMLEELYECATKNKADIVGCDFLWSFPDKEIYESFPLPNDSFDCTEKLLVGELHPAVWHNLIKRRVFVDNNLFWVAGIDMCEDLTIMAKIFPHAKSIGYIPKAYLHYNQRGGGSYTTTASVKSTRSTIAAINEIERYYKEIGVLERYDDSLSILKNHKKILIFSSYRGENRAEFKNLFPEAKSAVFKGKRRNIVWYLALYLTYFGRFELFDLLLWCCRCLVSLNK